MPLVAEAITDHHAAYAFKETVTIFDILCNPAIRARLSADVVALLEMCVDKKTGFMLGNRFANSLFSLIASGTGPYRAAPGAYAADSSGTPNGSVGIYVAQHLEARLPELCLIVRVLLTCRPPPSSFASRLLLLWRACRTPSLRRGWRRRRPLRFLLLRCRAPLQSWGAPLCRILATRANALLAARLGRVGSMECA